jgi:7-keto-8-aminopelargonate synthetase-like enzyme
LALRLFELIQLLHRMTGVHHGDHAFGVHARDRRAEARSEGDARADQVEPHRRRELLERAAGFRELLSQSGLDIAGATTQIVPIVVGEATDAVAVSTRLTEAGLFVPAIRPPSVPEGKSLVRVSLSWHHTADDVGRLVSTITSILSDRADS